MRFYATISALLSAKMVISDKNRVVVTGLGVIAPNGIGIQPFWSSLIAGRSAIGKITRFDASECRSQIAGEVRGFEPSSWIAAGLKPQRRARHTQFALAAVQMALQDAFLSPSMLELGYPLPISVGVASTCFDLVADSVTAVHKRGVRAAAPTVISESIPNAVAGAIGDMLQVPIAAQTLSSACVSGLDAVVHAAGLIRRGEADIAIAGGTDAPILPIPFANFDAGGMASRANDKPSKASRPFDLKRDSGVISEGCCFVVIENLESALARGIIPYLELLGASSHNDLSGMHCSGFEMTMERALHESNLLPTDIDYISAWGPGHPEIDRIETKLIKKVFGTHAHNVAVSSIKGVLGNPMSAAGPLMLASCCLAIRNDMIPPTANYEFPDPECDLDYVPKARSFRIHYAMINGHGVGGSNTSLIVGRS
jgi:3-oxoacyl-[acyl-carrier-protein] synthase II